MHWAPSVRQQPLPYVAQLAARDLASIELVVVHCTELPDLATARAYGERELYRGSTGNSGHYYIDRDGTTYGYVPDDRVAHHTRGHNARSIGIELVNLGRYPDWFDSRRQLMTEPYPPAQIDALRDLLAHLRRVLPNLRDIAGHEDLDPTLVAASDDPTRQVHRKLDPGPLFPWPRIVTGCPLQRLAPCPRPL